MIQGIFQTLGGLGLFLLGMVIMTDGLKQLAGNYLRSILTRYTNSPASGAITGAVSTAILQSSSATTVAAVGFVGAGLLTFPQALGIVFGANIGTTITGWLVALLGFKLKLSTMVLPLIFIGVLLKLFSRGRVASSGLALAGFGLIFIGITQLQSGMEGLEGLVTPDSFPADTIIGRLQLIALGILITLITQSSSAGVAAAITAIYTGTMTFPQAAAMVIGMDVGTTVTALIATIGGGMESRKTGYSHVIYNLFTALIAFLLLTPFTWVWNHVVSDIQQNAEIALVAFHSTFNIVGVFLILPFAKPFANLIQGLVPSDDSDINRYLDRTLLKDEASAIQAIKITLLQMSLSLYKRLADLLDRKSLQNEDQSELARQISMTRDYLQDFQDAGNSQPHELMGMIHTLDHLQRLHERSIEDVDRLKLASRDDYLSHYSDKLASVLHQCITALETGNRELAMKTSEDMATYFAIETPDIRSHVMEDVAKGTSTAMEGDARLEAIRSLRRSSQHVAKINLHMSDHSRAEHPEEAFLP